MQFHVSLGRGTVLKLSWLPNLHPDPSVNQIPKPKSPTVDTKNHFQVSGFRFRV